MVKLLPGVLESFGHSNGIRILTANAEAALTLAFEKIISQGLEVSEIKINKPNLESLFLKLTGRALRD